MKERYLYEFSTEGDWECLTDRRTGKKMERHRLNVDDVFFFLGIGTQLEIKEKDWEEDNDNDEPCYDIETGFDPYSGCYTDDC